jgi:hypothetical protein
MAALFLVFGVLLLLGTDSPSEDGLQILKMAFLVIWVIGCLGIIFLNLRIIVRPKDPAATAFVQLEDDGDGQPRGGSGTDFDGRLRKLEALRKDGLITEPEYRQKRAEILREKW